MSSPYQTEYCEVCKDDVKVEFEKGNGGGHADEPDTVDSYTCTECGAAHVWSSFYEKFVYDPPIIFWRG